MVKGVTAVKLYGLLRLARTAMYIGAHIVQWTEEVPHKDGLIKEAMLRSNRSIW